MSRRSMKGRRIVLEVVQAAELKREHVRRDGEGATIEIDKGLGAHWVHGAREEEALHANVQIRLIQFVARKGHLERSEIDVHVFTRARRQDIVILSILRTLLLIVRQ